MILTEIIFYSAIQGVSEFLPISSSGHLLILEKAYNWQISGRTYAIAAHLGTLFAVLFYLKKELVDLIFFIKKPKNYKFILNLILITLPIIIVGLLIFKTYDNILLTLKIVALTSILGSIILFYVDFATKENNKKMTELSYIQSFIIGIFQIFALIPGTSRAGCIITGARLFKLNRIEAAKLGLFTGIPSITGAIMLESSWLISNYKNYDMLILFLIIFLSGLFALISIKLLLKWLKNKSFTPFVIYRITLGIFILIYISN